MSQPHVEYVAHHWILLAVPAFLPAIIVVAVILYVALRDRRGRAPHAGAGKPGEPDERTGAADEKRD